MVTPDVTILLALTVTRGVTSLSMDHPLTKYRTDFSLSMDQVAKSAGTTRQTIHRIESRDMTPSLGLVARLIEASGRRLRADDFLPPTATPAASEPAQAENAA